MLFSETPAKTSISCSLPAPIAIWPFFSSAASTSMPCRWWRCVRWLTSSMPTSTWRLFPPSACWRRALCECSGASWGCHSWKPCVSGSTPLGATASPSAKTLSEGLSMVVCGVCVHVCVCVCVCGACVCVCVCTMLITAQGMTIRTAWLPGAGNLLGRAGEDLSGLPNQARHYHFVFLLKVSYFNSSTRFWVTMWQFLFCGSAIATSVSFYIIKPTDFSVVACDWLASAVKPVRS